MCLFSAAPIRANDFFYLLTYKHSYHNPAVVKRARNKRTFIFANILYVAKRQRNHVELKAKLYKYSDLRNVFN